MIKLNEIVKHKKVVNIAEYKQSQDYEVIIDVEYQEIKEKKQKKKKNIYKILTVISGTLMLCNIIFLASVIYKAGINIDLLLEPSLIFICLSIFHSTMKERYEND